MTTLTLPSLSESQKYPLSPDGIRLFVFDCDMASLIQAVIQSLTEKNPQKDSLVAFLVAFYQDKPAYNAGYLLHQLGLIEHTIKQSHRLNGTEPVLPEIRVEIDCGNDIIDMYLILFSEQRYPRLFFNDRFSDLSRNILLMYRKPRKFADSVNRTLSVSGIAHMN